MITRAQAEALLTLAESLEACERVGAYLREDDTGTYLFNSDGNTLSLQREDLSAQVVRRSVADLMPKHTGS